MEQFFPPTGALSANDPPALGSEIDLGRIIDETGRVRNQTIQEGFAQLMGRYVIGEFLIGTCDLYVQDGILSQVNQNTIVLYNERSGTYTSCDIYSIKFLTFFPADSPLRNMPEAQQRAYLERVRRIRSTSCIAPSEEALASLPVAGQTPAPLQAAAPQEFAQAQTRRRQAAQSTPAAQAQGPAATIGAPGAAANGWTWPAAYPVMQILE